MGIFDILKRKKKEDYLEMSPGVEEGAYGPAAGLPPMQGLDTTPLPGMPGTQQEFPPLPMADQSFQQPARSAASPAELDLIKQQVEAINYKIDSLKALLDNMNSRLANIEVALQARPAKKTEEWTY